MATGRCGMEAAPETVLPDGAVFDAAPPRQLAWLDAGEDDGPVGSTRNQTAARSQATRGSNWARRGASRQERR